MSITPGDFKEYGHEALCDAIELDKQAFEKGLEQGARKERERLALRINLDGLRRAFESGLIQDESCAMMAEILIEELSK